MTASAEPIPLDRDASHAEQARTLVLEGRIDEAAVLLHRQLGSRMKGNLRRHGVPEEDAEELVDDIWMRFIQTCRNIRVPAVVWLWTNARSILVEWVRAKGALKRGGRGESRLEVRVDDEALDVIIEAMEAPNVPGWLKLCVERAAHLLEHEDPNRAHVLWLWFTGHSAADIAVVFGATPPPTPEQETAARGRVFEATRKARKYFAHCND